MALNRPPLSAEQILAWAEAHRERSGRWPTAEGGPVDASGEETWKQVDVALRQGYRGLPGGDSLFRLLARTVGKPSPPKLPPLTAEQILAWADLHRARTGRWPDSHSGPVLEAPYAGETWGKISAALRQGCRGLPGGASLVALLAEHRGVRDKRHRPRLTVAQVRDWAEAHRRRTGSWPTRNSGEVADAPGEKWQSICMALREGYRGLPGGMSLSRTVRGLE
jgi:hypothetical protein